jgi:cation:H+ antiporter
MAWGLGLLAVSAAMLIAGAELFSENVGAAARRLRITVFAAAFLLAGAEPEEMGTAAIASGRHHPGLAAGDAIGANLTMLTLVLGLAALARPLPFTGRVRGYAVWSALAGGVAVLVIAGGGITRWQEGCCWPPTWPGWRCCGGGNASRQLSGRRPRPARKAVSPGPRCPGWRWRWAGWR